MKKIFFLSLFVLSCTNPLQSFSVPTVTTMGIILFVIKAIANDVTHTDCPDGDVMSEALSYPWTAGGC